MKTLNYAPLRGKALNQQYGELSEWLKEHAWKVCIRQRIESSNLSLTAKFLKKDVLGRLFLCLQFLKSNNLPHRTIKLLLLVTLVFLSVSSYPKISQKNGNQNDLNYFILQKKRHKTFSTIQRFRL